MPYSIDCINAQSLVFGHLLLLLKKVNLATWINIILVSDMEIDLHGNAGIHKIKNMENYLY